jgi:diacylglycerol kinase family enzyme
MQTSITAAQVPDVSLTSAPFMIVLNSGSGHHDSESVQQTIEQILTQAGRRYRLFLIKDVKKIKQVSRDAVTQAQAERGIVVVAGGDGTINAVANEVLHSGCAFGVLPQGTFNYFGRTHGISEDLAESTQSLLRASITPVQVGLVNDRVFLVNASMGLYPKILEDRETYKRQYGRSRMVAFWAALMTVLQHKKHLGITLESDQKKARLRTPTLFVGNNRLQMEQTGIPLGEAIDDGQLAAITLRPTGLWPLLWLGIRGALGSLGEADNVISFPFREMTVTPWRLGRKRPIKVATDGEIQLMRAPIVFRVSPQPLYLLKPVATSTNTSEVNATSLFEPLAP